MNFVELIQNLVRDTVDVSLPSFLPELILVATIVAMLLLRVLSWNRASGAAAQFLSAWLPLAGAVIALVATTPWFYLSGQASDPNLGSEIFTGMLVHDAFTIYFRALLLLFVVLFVIFTQLSGIPDREDAADFYTLVLGGTIGMCLMASANHLLIVFLAVEMASVPSYALAGMLKGRRQSSEAALKYVVYGAGTAGIMLYGISLLAGVTGTCHLPTVATRLAEILQAGPAMEDRYMVLVLGGLMTMVGLAFKLSAFPFHFWCPDVFEGASAEVNAYLSVASKAAALALLVRVGLGLGYVPESREPRLVEPPPAEVAVASAAKVHVVRYAEEGDPPAEAPAANESRAAINQTLAPVRQFAVWVVGFLAALTCTFGNLAAYGQTNIKRLLAYSTIAHAGYMMMPIAAALQMVGTNPNGAADAISGMAFYVGAYLFMNLGAFAIVAFLRNALRSEEIDDYAGLVRRCPGMVVAFSIILFSLIGMPPLVGFMAKVAIFYPLVESGQYALLVIACLNTVVSLFYYLRVVKVMTLDPEPEHRLPVEFSMLSLAGAYVVFITAPVVALAIRNDTLFDWTKAAASSLLS
ncbi:MAG: NADH-quinone oxidoreductase subunit N [Pirellulales bacterium]|nr:NADH-quinone oxidoreductase subunit N [Pirellulales bacterium]